MKSSSDPSVGTNLTGLAHEPERRAELLAAAEEFPPTSRGNEHSLAQTRETYGRQSEPIGSIPLLKHHSDPNGGTDPASLQALLFDKLGERLAFEASGTRLYEALIDKLAVEGGFDNGPTVEDLRDLHAEEHRHFLWLQEAIEQLGGDPSALTPAANVAAVASMGVAKVLTDPRTTLLQCLDSVLMLELLDNDCWETLIDLVREAGEGDMAKRFERALIEETEHLRKVRAWLAAGHGRQEAFRRLTPH